MRNARFHTRSLAIAGLATAATLAGQTAASAAASPPVSSHGTPAAARGVAAGGPGHWSQVTASGTPVIADIGLVRGTDGVLHVIWAEGATPGREKITDTPIGAGGTPGTPVGIASGQFLVTDPDATATPSGLDVFWNGIQTSKPSSPEGTFEATRPVKGGHWTLAGAIPPLPAIPFTSSSDSAGTGSDGKPWVAFAGTDSLTVIHLGHKETEIPPTACCVYEPGFGTDGAAGTTWLAYQSLITGKQGVYVQRLSETGASGAAVRLPGSETGGSTFPLSQRVGITGRGHGRAGVYVLYGSGYPAYTALDLLKVGASTPLKLATFGGFTEEAAGDTIAAGPNGRLWATWFDGDGTPPQLFVRASGTTGLTFGPTAHVALPSGTDAIDKVYTSAQDGRLDVVALLTRHGTTAYFATQVLLPTAKKATTAIALASSAAPSWHVVKSLPAGSKGGSFTAVVATGKTTAWAFDGNGGAIEPTAWELRGSTWTKAPFPGKNDEEVDAAGATSPNDVWAFTNGFTSSGTGIVARVLWWNGHRWSVKKTFPDLISGASVVAANDVWVFGVGAQYAAWHYNGGTWTQEGTAVDGGSALAANDAWGYTGTFVEHWPGRKWVATNVANLLPPKRSGNSPALSGVIALSPDNVYAIGNGYQTDSGGPTVILHYNGLIWSRVAEGDFGFGPPAQQASPDGKGGLWLPMPDIDALPSYFVHYSNGKLAQAKLPASSAQFTIDAASLIPGTSDALAGGFTHPKDNPTQPLAAVILQYS